ncbi:MAG: SAM-dependent methyltransferase [Phenylobacterium sp.]|uniref:class I SAM-dependent methyltransferase n=1 Tax=Phenylobacterium sp. TaxID=1871053 RepID=UPI0025E1DDA1|nr:SAM-dependent methyltransferase [Phenylobacterium sp.]MCA6297919.1 SAM-dependent methyltransferase [Phenylobacterium sp.]
MSLAARIADRIRTGGPISVAEYMHLCLHDPADGYYATRPALGSEGDFITAPLVSQMFGELIGLWMVELWRQMGRPTPFRLVELGPGDGTLMADLHRAARLEPGFPEAAETWLVEPSRPFRDLQRQRLGPGPFHADRLEEVPPGAPLLLVGNEVLDCLPARQWEWRGDTWKERRIGLEGDRLVLGLAPAPQVRFAADAPWEGAVLEHSAAQEALGSEIGARIAADGGAALLIDYGRAQAGLGDTLQALRGHVREDPLAHPGQADLTVHADFPTMLAAARREGIETAGPVAQGRFLDALGLRARAAALTRTAGPGEAARLERQVARLTAADQMGELFLAAALHSPGLQPPGFGAPP